MANATAIRKRPRRSLRIHPSRANLRQYQPGASTWKWTPAKREALRLLLDGATLTAIGNHVKKHRHTVREWIRNATFQRELVQRLEEHRTSKRLRRTRMTSALLDHIEGIVLDALTGKSSGDNDELLGKLRAWRQEYCSLRDQERKDFSDLDKRTEQRANPIETRGGGRLSDTSFVELVRQVCKPNEVIEAQSPDEIAVVLAERVLMHPGVLDRIAEEDGRT